MTKKSVYAGELQHQRSVLPHGVSQFWSWFDLVALLHIIWCFSLSASIPCWLFLMGAMRFTSWYRKFNGSHFVLPPSSIHKITHWVAKWCEPWGIWAGPIVHCVQTLPDGSTLGFALCACQVWLSLLVLRHRGVAVSRACFALRNLLRTELLQEKKTLEDEFAKHKVRRYQYMPVDEFLYVFEYIVIMGLSLCPSLSPPPPHPLSLPLPHTPPLLPLLSPWVHF